MSSISEDIADVVTRLEANGIPATDDPRVAVQATGVIVLVEPPTRDYVRLIQTWQLTVLRNTSDVGIDTTKALGVVLAQLEAADDFPIEEARPEARRLSIERPPVPAYICRFTSP